MCYFLDSSMNIVRYMLHLISGAMCLRSWNVGVILPLLLIIWDASYVNLINIISFSMVASILETFCNQPMGIPKYKNHKIFYDLKIILTIWHAWLKWQTLSHTCVMKPWPIVWKKLHFVVMLGCNFVVTMKNNMWTKGNNIWENENILRIGELCYST